MFTDEARKLCIYISVNMIYLKHLHLTWISELKKYF